MKDNIKKFSSKELNTIENDYYSLLQGKEKPLTFIWLIYKSLLYISIIPFGLIALILLFHGFMLIMFIIFFVILSIWHFDFLYVPYLSLFYIVGDIIGVINFELPKYLKNINVSDDLLDPVVSKICMDLIPDKVNFFEMYSLNICSFALKLHFIISGCIIQFVSMIVFVFSAGLIFLPEHLRQKKEKNKIFELKEILVQNKRI